MGHNNQSSRVCLADSWQKTLQSSIDYIESKQQNSNKDISLLSSCQLAIQQVQFLKNSTNPNEKDIELLLRFTTYLQDFYTDNPNHFLFQQNRSLYDKALNAYDDLQSYQQNKNQLDDNNQNNNQDQQSKKSITIDAILAAIVAFLTSLKSSKKVTPQKYNQQNDQTQAQVPLRKKPDVTILKTEHHYTAVEKSTDPKGPYTKFKVTQPPTITAVVDLGPNEAFANSEHEFFNHDNPQQRRCLNSNDSSLLVNSLLDEESSHLVENDVNLP